MTPVLQLLTKPEAISRIMGDMITPSMGYSAEVKLQAQIPSQCSMFKMNRVGRRAAKSFPDYLMGLSKFRSSG